MRLYIQILGFVLTLTGAAFAQNAQVTFVKSNLYAVSIQTDLRTQTTVKIARTKTLHVLVVPKGTHRFTINYFFGYADTQMVQTVNIVNDTLIDLSLGLNATLLGEIEVQGETGSAFTKATLKQVDGMAIYAGKKTEVIYLKNSKANTATNNGREVYAKIAGLNIWESDAGGMQLGIGGRGLSPNRTSNFNTRQNGYDISADALGYPESYYSPVPDMVERIEVVRGASSLQYGTQFGGLVNFKMKQAPADYVFRAACKLTAGSFGFFNVTPQISYGTRKVGIYAAYQYKKGNGFREYTWFNNHSAFISAYYKIKRHFSLGIDITKMGYVSQQPGGLTDALFNTKPDTVLRKRNWFAVNWNLASIYMDYLISEKTKLNTRFFGLFSNRSNVGYLGQINRPDLGQPRELITGMFTNIGNETRLLSTYKWNKSFHTLLIGYRLYAGKTQAMQGLALKSDGADFNFKHPNEVDYSAYTFPSKNVAFFAENIFRVGSKFTITPGLRYEYLDTRSQGYYFQRSYDLSGDTLLEKKNHTASKTIRDLVLGGLGIAFKPYKTIETFANASMNYRAINFSDIAIVNPNFKVDTLMKDESGYTLDAGVRGGLKNYLTFDVSTFYMAYNNRIGEIFKVDDFSYNIIRYRTNIGNSYNYGIESFAEFDLIRALNDSSKWSLPIFVNYAYTEAYYSKSEAYAIAGKRVEFVPRHMLRTGLNLAYKNYFVACNYAYLSEQFSDATNATKTTNAIYGTIPAYWVMDAAAGYRSKKLSVEAHANNLTNNMYFTRRATGYPGPGIIPSETRSFYITIGYNFE